MGLLKRSLIVTILVVSQTAQANCVEDCKAALNAADKVIADLHQEIDLYKSKDDALTKALTDSNVSLNEKNAELTAFYRNPFIIGTLGILLGVGGVLLLQRHN